jgi:hypothetical protein
MISNGRMIVNHELGRMWKEAVVIYFKVLVLSKHLPGGTVENQENLRISGVQAEIRSRDVQDTKQANDSTAMFCADLTDVCL